MLKLSAPRYTMKVPIHAAFGVGTTRVSGSGVEIGVDDVSGHGDVT
jgi:hypothetical protein